jgi:hypothetical protein
MTEPKKTKSWSIGIVLLLPAALACGSFCISAVVLCGYILDMQSLTTWSNRVAMSLPSAVCIIALSVAVFLMAFTLISDDKPTV